MEKLPKQNALQAANSGGKDEIDFNKGVKASFVVRCSCHPEQATEFLTLVVNGRPYCGAKREYKNTPVGSNIQTSEQQKPLATKTMEMINGVTRECLFCDHEVILKCHCDGDSCATNGEPHTCPHCNSHTPIVKLLGLIPPNVQERDRKRPESISGILKSPTSHKRITNMGSILPKK